MDEKHIKLLTACISRINLNNIKFKASEAELMNSLMLLSNCILSLPDDVRNNIIFEIKNNELHLKQKETIIPGIIDK